MNIPKEFGIILKAYREEAGISQTGLANDSKLNKTYISLLERGLRQPTISVIFQLAEALEISPAELVAKLEKATRFKSAITMC